MLSDIHVVLLIPIPDDPHGLLQEGVCGAKPPTVALWERPFGHPPSPWSNAPLQIGSRPLVTALVLAWDGHPVPEGLDRLRRVLWRENCSIESFGIREMEPEMAQVIHMVKKLAAPRLGCRYLALDDFGHGAFDDFGQGVFDAE